MERLPLHGDFKKGGEEVKPWMHPARRSRKQGARLCEPQRVGRQARVDYFERSLAGEAAAGHRPALRGIFSTLSGEFGRDLIDRILKPLLVSDKEGVIKRGTVADKGSLSKEFSYLEDYVTTPDQF